ncbi:hypothetical protein EYS09_26175 [Streptomyces kasugaensis]|uniref:Uncharacterized protein n=1 Tax=Streptomyces kasugaensis TaxID=1946 RepID=A0A4Q9HPE1_STRKA|nr:hypothetical protein [Streptomyces kasugaensis]TBO56764.1 hypothetical protein EYS09_26175 [Streptomyces kasugaensis]
MTRVGAEQHGVSHRRRRHAGDYPDGECILRSGRRAKLPPRGGEWIAVAITVALIAIALLAKAF